MLGSTGKYRLDQRLGGGGMAEVFLGSTQGAEGFQRKVAIKRVLPGFSDNPSFAQMFVSEAQISAQLQHPNIVSVLDFDRDGENRLFLVMELVEGRDLDTLLSSGVLPFSVVVFVISEVLRGLGHAHDLPVGGTIRGIVHRDVSPHNVLLSWEGAVKVSDFGIAKAKAASEATASVFIKGKPAYMSPEQANGEALDGRSDLFAVGIMMWEMLVGRRLFTGDDTRATLAAVLFGQIPRPRSQRPDVPADLEHVCMKLLERDLPARYATAEDANADLMECADAPRNGREQLVQILAERYPQLAPVRSSKRHAGMHTPQSIPPIARNVADGSQPYTPAATPVVPMASVGAQRAAATGTMDPQFQMSTVSGRPPKSRALVLVAALIASAAIAFAIVMAVTHGKHGESGGAGSAGSNVAIAPTIDAASAMGTTSIDAGMADATVPLVAMIDAGVPSDTAPDAKKDASLYAGVHPPAATQKTGLLVVKAFPIMTITVDHKRYGDTPQTIKLSVGAHKLELSNNELGIDETQAVTISENHPTVIDKTNR
ncbi:MAG TPA: serine/threonine-protein kinase [Kofleriaceae bacterium]|jgi:serine/threonine protein kinase|nr:serine/threonine-protein kinase [Kofleriaceae bacterium]